MRMLAAIIPILTALLFLSCSDSEPVQPGVENLIANGSFEEGGSPSSRGWTKSGDTSLIRIERDPETPCGEYAQTVETGWGITYVETTVASGEGTHVFRLDFRGRATGRSGHATLGLDDGSQPSATIAVTGATWETYTLLDTLTVPSGARIRLRLHGGFSQLEVGKTWYDCVTLEKKE